jgi:tetratricopeptide (TPR) repeat protein
MLLRAYIAAFTVILLLICSPPSVSAGPGNQYYNRGRKLAAAGKYPEAAESFENAIAKDPDHVMARYHLGLVYMKNILTFERAEQMLLEVPLVAMQLTRKPRDDIFFLAGISLGKLYIKSGRHNRAIQLILSVVSSAPPGSPLDEAYNTLGLAYYFERLYGEAIFEFRRAIKYNPDNSEAKFNLKTIRSRLEHYEAGKIYSRIGEQKEAIAQFRKAIGLDPRFVEARHRLGLELLAQGNSTLALTELHRAESITSHYRKMFQIWYAQGLALKSLGKKIEAMNMFQKTIEARPTFAAAHNAAGTILMDMGEYDEAIMYFARAIGIDPKTEYVRNMLKASNRKGQ